MPKLLSKIKTIVIFVMISEMVMLVKIAIITVARLTTTITIININAYLN